MPLESGPGSFKRNIKTLMGEVGQSPHVQSRAQALAIAYAKERKRADGGAAAEGEDPKLAGLVQSELPQPEPDAHDTRLLRVSPPAPLAGPISAYIDALTRVHQAMRRAQGNPPAPRRYQAGGMADLEDEQDPSRLRRRALADLAAAIPPWAAALPGKNANRLDDLMPDIMSMPTAAPMPTGPVASAADPDPAPAPAPAPSDVGFSPAPAPAAPAPASAQVQAPAGSSSAVTGRFTYDDLVSQLRNAANITSPYTPTPGSFYSALQHVYPNWNDPMGASNFPGGQSATGMPYIATSFDAPNFLRNLGFTPRAHGGVVKVSKQSVHYSKGMRTRRCGLCRFFIQGGACRRVEGKIDPAMWCRLFRDR